MTTYKIKSYAKVNLSLNIIRKKKNGLHEIESIVTFLKLHDKIKIKEIKGKKNKVIFSGKFSKNIPKKNTVSHLLDILEKNKYLKNKKYKINILKNIPQKSGMGGGSMNASSILIFLIKKKIIYLKKKEIKSICNQVGSDVILGLENKNSIIYPKGDVIRNNKKLGLNTLVVKPNFGCSTKEIYSNLRSFSKIEGKKNFNLVNLARYENDLEKVALKKYPSLLSLKKSMTKVKGVIFVRMSGSGSSMIGYFSSKKAVINAKKILQRKYKKYWFASSKTI
tara:strand:- start:16967 stop:17803 length:837 start_codon:yes stop_codon:yes gene_type:complete